MDPHRQTIRDRSYEGSESLVLLCRSAYAEVERDRTSRAAIGHRVARLLKSLAF